MKNVMIKIIMWFGFVSLSYAQTGQRPVYPGTGCGSHRYTQSLDIAKLDTFQLANAHFRIIYTLTDDIFQGSVGLDADKDGIAEKSINVDINNALPMIFRTDNDGIVGIPDRIEEIAEDLEFAYDVYINQMGFKKPISGSDMIFDAYILAMTDLHEHACYEEGSNILSESFILVNNGLRFNVNERGHVEDENKPLTVWHAIGSRAAMAHELHHLIQFAYGFASEGLSMWAEHIAFPQDEGWKFAAGDFFSRQRRRANVVNGLFAGNYRFGILGHFLEQFIGEPSIIRRVMEGIQTRPGISRKIVLNDSLKAISNSSIQLAIEKFTEWNVFSGWLDDGNHYTFEGSQLNPPDGIDIPGLFKDLLHIEQDDYRKVVPNHNASYTADFISDVGGHYIIIDFEKNFTGAFEFTFRADNTSSMDVDEWGVRALAFELSGAIEFDDDGEGGQAMRILREDESISRTYYNFEGHNGPHSFLYPTPTNSLNHKIQLNFNATDGTMEGQLTILNVDALNGLLVLAISRVDLVNSFPKDYVYIRLAISHL